jgi:hypothetical protein
MILPADSCVPNTFLVRHHSMLECIDSGVKQCSHVWSQVTICSRNVFPFQFKLVQTLSRHSCCAFWLNINIFWNEQACAS